MSMPNKNRHKTVELVSTEQVQPDSTHGLLPLDEPLLKKRIARRTKVKIIIAAIVVALLCVYLGWDLIFHGPLMSLLSNRDELVRAVEKSGPFAPLLYICLQIIQTVVAPIPGQVVGSVGGFIFGIWGIVWTTIGTIIGCYIVFRIARRFGRPLLEKIFKKSVIDQFDFILNAKSASLILFAIFLLPGFPDDVVCYVAGMTKLPIRRLVVIMILGRFPMIVLTNFLGAGLSDNLGLVAIVSVLAILILGLALWKRDFVMSVLKGERKLFSKKGK